MFILSKFPFKSMLPMVSDLQTRNQPLSITDLQVASRACYPDTSEIIHMMSYMASFGKIIKTSTGWKRISNHSEIKSTKPTRVRYLQNLILIINQLSEEPISLNVLQAKLNIPIEDLKECLDFLLQLTKYGHIVNSKNGWILQSFN